MDDDRASFMTTGTGFITWIQPADQMLGTATKDQLAETARLLALNLAQYQQRFGVRPLENIEELLRTKESDEGTAQLQEW
jgi:hypothetical protein